MWLTALAAVTTTVTGRGPLVAFEQHDPQIAALLEPIRVKHHLPALGGAIVTSQGLRSLGVTGVRKAGADVAATADDLWHLGSDTKAMTAVVIAKLVEQGKLTWDTTIEAVLPKPVANARPEFGGVTLLQLLSHRAGLVANLNWPQLARTPGPPRAQRLAALQTAASTPLASPPGTKYEYSNLGYVIAATMAETVADRAWEDMIRDVVFKPLGMTSVGFGGTGTTGQIDQPWPHQANGQPMPANGPAIDNPPIMGPAGTVHCSLADWARFVADQLRGLQGHGALLCIRELQIPAHRAVRRQLLGRMAGRRSTVGRRDGLLARGQQHHELRGRVDGAAQGLRGAGRNQSGWSRGAGRHG